MLSSIDIITKSGHSSSHRASHKLLIAPFDNKNDFLNFDGVGMRFENKSIEIFGKLRSFKKLFESLSKSAKIAVNHQNLRKSTKIYEHRRKILSSLRISKNQWKSRSTHGRWWWTKHGCNWPEPEECIAVQHSAVVIVPLTPSLSNKE